MIDIEIPGEFDYKVTAKETAGKILKDINKSVNCDARECAVKCIAYMIHELSTNIADLNITMLYSDPIRWNHYVTEYNKETDNVDMKFLCRIGNAKI